MQIPTQTKPALWGAAAGAVAVLLLGFNAGGWLTAGKAEAMAMKRADDSVVAALAPLCAERFRQDGAAVANLAALKATESWSRAEYVDKGGWAAMQKDASTVRQSAVTQACVLLLVPA